MHSKFIDLMRGNRDHHQKKVTLFSHLVGVPLITLGVLILFGWIKVSIPGIFTLSAAWIGIIIFAIYYLIMDLLIGAVTTAILIVFCAITSALTINGPSALSEKLFIVIFILGLIFQLIGYLFEGKKPLLLKNFFSSVSIAPFLVTAEILFMLGLKEDLQKQVLKVHEEENSDKTQL